jgi:sialic acid synthase SpsE
MSQIILDMGSGNTCKNSVDYAYKMIDAVAAIDSHKHEVIFKWQLFQDEPPNVPLDHLVFGRAYAHAKGFGYKTTSSVFDKPSLDFLLNFDIPFVKIACRPRIYWLIGEVPRKLPVYVSWTGEEMIRGDIIRMFCVPKYPAEVSDYPKGASVISDHTRGLDLWKQSSPRIWEKHFVLEYDPNNPDAALGHAIKPDLLKEVLGA